MISQFCLVKTVLIVYIISQFKSENNQLYKTYFILHVYAGSQASYQRENYFCLVFFLRILVK